MSDLQTAQNPTVTPITALRGVSDKLAEKLARLGLFTIQDVLFHIPLRYEDRTQLTPIRHLLPGQNAVVAGKILSAEVRQGRRRSLLVSVQDATGTLVLRFFNFYASQLKQLCAGNLIQCFGEVRAGSTGFEMTHPEYRLVGPDQVVNLETSLTPIYPSTAGLQQKRLLAITDQALSSYLPQVEDVLPEFLRDQFQLIDLRTALRRVHRPEKLSDQQQTGSPDVAALRRLAFEELLAQHLSLLDLRAQRQQRSADVVPSAWAAVGELISALPFTLTNAQQRVVAEISGDLGRPFPMMRMIQGDVGSGKTIVAAVAALQTVSQGHQVALMAPTELLAEQHFENFRQWLAPLNINVELLTGKRNVAHRRQALNNIADGEAQVVVGTHALIQDDTRFHRLGLMIIDEQHRFGVKQRLALTRKMTSHEQYPHQLFMTATPIPRSLAMTFYADLDLSVIDELPPNRQPVNTVVMPENRRDALIVRIRDYCQQGHQAYWVCGLIDDSDAVEAQAATELFEQLKEVLPSLQLGLVHGRMKVSDKETVMRAFKSGDTDLLVATTVIEVGVDVPNASLMIIENSERLGLAQLHQLRGRVGRGSQQSSCVLLYKNQLSKTARARLKTLRETNDGFEIARRDLELRGPGELLGTRQTGIQQLKIADLVRDADLLPQVTDAAKILQTSYPERIELLLDRWIGRAMDYQMS